MRAFLITRIQGVVEYDAVMQQSWHLYRGYHVPKSSLLLDQILHSTNDFVD